MLTRRPTDLGHGPIPDDYEIRSEGKTVGRIYKTVNVIGEPWFWSITIVRRHTLENSGYAPTLEAGLEAFKAAWNR